MGNPPAVDLRAGEGAFAGTGDFFIGQDTLLLEDAGLLWDACDEINWAYLSGIIIAQGNAATSALSKNAVVFCEPEWGWDITGLGGGNYVGSHYTGGGALGNITGGLTVAW